MNPTKQLDTWIAEHGSCRDALNVALAQLELAKMALEEVEFAPIAGYYDYQMECPWCDCTEKQGHSSDCARQIVLTPPAPSNS